MKSLHTVLDIPGQKKLAVKPTIIMAAAAGEGFPSPQGAEKDLLPYHYTIEGVAMCVPCQ